MGNRLGGASQWVERVIEILFAFGVGGAKVEVFEVSDRFVGTASFKQSDTYILGRHPCGVFFRGCGCSGYIRAGNAGRVRGGGNSRYGIAR